MKSDSPVGRWRPRQRREETAIGFVAQLGDSGALPDLENGRAVACPCLLHDGHPSGASPALWLVAVSKQELRDRAWAAIREAGVARFPGVEGRIPNFLGAEAAADRLAGTPEWDAASVLKCNPDSPQLPVRKRALADGKTVYMAVPKLAEPQPFWRLDPEELDVRPHEAASIKGAGRHGRPVSIEEMEAIDLIVCGSVAVERAGARLGKGGGYSDLEFAIAVEAGLVEDSTVVASTVHPSQIFSNGTIPLTDHDLPIDLIVTPDEAIYTRTRIGRPKGVLDDHLEEERRGAIPVLRC
jgi:5-formyltetrahydrofolate cyclo-ligase